MSGEARNGDRWTPGSSNGVDPRVVAAAARQAQALGFRAATDVATSMLPYFFGDEAPGAPPPSALVRELLARGDQLADGLASVVRGAIAPLVDYLEATAQAAAGGPSGETIECVARPGQSATATGSIAVATDVGPARIWATGVTHASGVSVAAEQIRCIPAAFEALGGGTAVPVRIVIDVPGDATPGSYFGHLLCTARPDGAQPVRLHVLGEDSDA